MKKAGLLILLMLFIGIGFGQTVEKNLKLVDFISIDSVSTFFASPVFTVPVGKIWKIENIIVGNYGYVNINSNSTQIISGQGGSSPIYRCYNPNSPVWLSSGEKIIFSYQASDFRFKFSAFEFVLE